MARFTVHLLPPGRRLDRGAPRLVAAVVTFIVGLFGALPTAHAAGIALQDSAGTNLTSPGTYGWVGSWMTAADRAGKAKPAATGFADKTLRQVVDLSLGGDRIRVRLTNVFGERRLRIGLASVALRSERAGAATQGQPLALTFGGKRAVDIPVGAEVVSDPVTLPVPDGARLLISLYLPTPTGPATVHHRGWATTFQARGNAALDPRGTRFTPIGTSSYFLSGVDVLTRSTGAVVAFGDSITEGCCEPSFVDADRSYPDLLAAAAVAARRLGVLNAGISGNALLSDGSGVSGLGRFERDVLRRPGVRSVIILEGINDLIRSKGAVRPDQLITGYLDLVRRAKAAGLRVIGATLTPYGGSRGYTRAGEQTRRIVNNWIRNSGTFDAVIDFDRRLHDPADPTRFRATFDPGDHLHPNAAGYRAMATLIDPLMLDPQAAPMDSHPDVTVVGALTTYLREEERFEPFGEHLGSAPMVQLPMS